MAPQSAGSGAFGNDFISAKWNVNLTGAYIMPWDINLGASLSARQGYAQPYRSSVSGLNGGTITVILDPIGDIRFDNVYELDLRLAKDFRLMNRVGMTLSGDLFNAPNKRCSARDSSSTMPWPATPHAPAVTASPRCSLPASGDSAPSSTSKFFASCHSGPPEFLRRAFFYGQIQRSDRDDQWIESHCLGWVRPSAI